METFPWEVLIPIFEWLDNTDLCSATRVCRAFEHAASQSLFRDIVIRPSRKGRLRRKIIRWLAIVKRRDCLQHVRRLEISRFTTASNECRDDPDEFSYLEQWRAMTMEPLLTLVESLPGLESLIWRCPEILPRRLICMVNRRRPRVELHLDLFSLRGLNGPKISKPFSLARLSKSLVGITFYSGIGSLYDMEEYRYLVSELIPTAPHLKTVKVVQQPPLLWWLTEEEYQFLRIPSKLEPPVQSAKLRSLILTGEMLLDSDWIRRWEQFVDFRELSHLELLTDSLPSSLIACRFHRLRKFQLRTCHTSRPCYHEPIDESRLARDLNTLLSNCDGLHSLELAVPITLRSVKHSLFQHGETLTSLDLHSCSKLVHTGLFLTERDILELQNHCPLLRTLSISIQRVQSTNTETRIYQALGQFRRLRELSLDLNCASWATVSTSVPWFSSYPIRKKGRRSIRQGFIDASVDEDLVKQIWRVIASRKAGSRLQSLGIRLSGLEEPHILAMSRPPDVWSISQDVFLVFRRLSRGGYFQLRGSMRDDSEAEYCEVTTTKSEGFISSDLPDQMMEILKDLWPNATALPWWENEFNSFPLQMN